MDLSTTVCLLHGFYHKPSHMAQMKKELEQNGFTNVHSIDYRGFKDGNIPSTKFIGSCVRQGVKEIECLGIRKVILVGHSLGTIVARELAEELNKRGVEVEVIFQVAPVTYMGFLPITGRLAWRAPKELMSTSIGLEHLISNDTIEKFFLHRDELDLDGFSDYDQYVSGLKIRESLSLYVQTMFYYGRRIFQPIPTKLHCKNVIIHPESDALISSRETKKFATISHAEHHEVSGSHCAPLLNKKSLRETARIIRNVVLNTPGISIATNQTTKDLSTVATSL